MKAVKKPLYLVLIIHFCFMSCAEEELEPTIGRPQEFFVSKGAYIDRIILSWKPAPLSKKFQIFRSESLSDDFTLLNETVNTTYSDTTDVVPNTTYYYKVRAYNSEKEFSDFSDFDEGYVVSLQTPAYVDASYGSSETLSLQWPTATGAEAYIISKSSDKAHFEAVDTVSQSYWVDEADIEAGITYYYMVQSFHSKAGASEYSLLDSGYALQKYVFSRDFGDFVRADGLEVDALGNVYISDGGSGKVKKFDSNFSLVNQSDIGEGLLSSMGWTHDGKLLTLNYHQGTLYSFGSDLTPSVHRVLPKPNTIIEFVYDEIGNTFLTDATQNTVSKLSPDGSVLKTWQLTQSTIESFYTGGMELVDSRLFIGGVNSSEAIEIYDTDGNFLSQWGFSYPAGRIAADGDGNLYFSTFSDTVVKTTQEGKILAFIGGSSLDRTINVKVNSAGMVFVLDEETPNRAFVFTEE